MYYIDGFEWVYIEFYDCCVFFKINCENYIQK